MIHILPEEVELLSGTRNLDSRCLSPYSLEACSFLDNLSKELQKISEIKNYPDVLTFSFWCRLRNIENLKRQFDDGKSRLGRGLSFHIAPSNVPVNFAFSLAFGILAGNPTIVRVPSDEYPQVNLICKTITRLLLQDKHARLQSMLALIRYGKNTEINRYLSSKARSRVIWGGDNTVAEFKSFPTPTRAIDIVFGDRTSLAIMHTNSIELLSEKELRTLAERFYNDTFLMDQKACSSPHLIVWLGKGSAAARNSFWNMLNSVVNEKYSIEFVESVDKFTQLCRDAIRRSDVLRFEGQETLVYRVMLNSLSHSPDKLKGEFGYFFEYEATDLYELSNVLTERYQTLTYFGLQKEELLKFVVENRLPGIDRIVPVGAGLDIGVLWDGVDVIETLTRIVDVH